LIFWLLAVALQAVVVMRHFMPVAVGLVDAVSRSLAKLLGLALTRSLLVVAVPPMGVLTNRATPELTRLLVL
jgi:hypothetical protein